MAGEVRGGYQLDAAQARRELTGLRNDATVTQLAMENLGHSIDGIGTPAQHERINLLTSDVRGLAEESVSTGTIMREQWQSTERQVAQSSAVMEASIDRVQRKMDGLSRTRATPTIDTRGIASSMAEIQALELQLDSIDRRRAIATVGARPSFGTLAGAGGGGGGPGRSVATSAFGIPALRYAALGGAALGFGPSLLGGAGALGGSLLQGGLGVGALGLGGYSLAATSAAALLPVGASLVSSLHQVSQAQTAYDKTVAQYGRDSTQAATSQKALNAAIQLAPAGVGAFESQLKALEAHFKTATAPASSNLLGLGTNALQAGNRLTSAIAPDINAFSGQFGSAGGSFFNFLAGQGSQNFLHRELAFAGSEMQPIEHILENILATVQHITIAGNPFLRDLVSSVEKITYDWRTGTADIHTTRAEIGKLVEQAKHWEHLTSSTFTLLKDIANAGAPTGGSMLESMTQTLDQWDHWINNNPEKVQSFFRTSATELGHIATAIGHIAQFLGQMSKLLAPTLDELAQFISFAGNAGLLQPGMLPLLIGGIGGGRAAMGGLRGAISGQAGAPSTVATVGAVGAGALLARGRVATAALPSTITSATTAAELSAAQRAFPFSGMGGVPMTARSAAGAFPYAGMEALQGIPEVASTAGVGSRLLTLGGGALRGAASRFLPVAGLIAGLQALSFPGSVTERGQAAASSLTLGAIPMPQTGQQVTDQFTQAASQILGRFQPGVGGLAAQRHELGRLHALTASPRMFNSDWNRTATRVPGWEQFRATIGNRFPDIDLSKVSDDQVRALFQQAQGLEHQTATGIDQRRGAGFFDDIKGGLQIRLQHGQSGATALGAVRDSMISDVGKIKGAAQQNLAQGILDILQQFRAAHPKMKDQVRSIIQDLTNELSHGKDQFTNIQGQIVNVNANTWSTVAKQMQSQTEKAREVVSANFTAIQKQAAAVLQQMGFTGSQARAIVSAQDPHTNALHGARIQAGAGLGTEGIALNPKLNKALGGRLGGGFGGLDRVPLGDGSHGAAGELVVNSWSEQRADRLLRGYGLSLADIVGGEQRTQDAWHARGGRLGMSDVWRGLPPTGLHPGIRDATQALLSHFPGLSVTSTTGGGHVSGSYHYLGEATDTAGSTEEMYKAAQWIKSSGLYRSLAEGIHNPNLSVSNGSMVPSSYYSSVWAEHANHIHMAVVGAINAAKLGGGARGGAGAGFSPVHLHGMGASGFGGALGGMVAGAGNLEAAALSHHINHVLGHQAGGSISAAGFKGGGSARANEALGRRMMLSAGWGASQWPALLSLWTQESGWDSNAVNPSSGAYGIPQSLGHGHPYDLGDAPAQIAWGLNYIRDRYGSPASAWAHEQANNWYSRGGRMPFGGWFGNGGDLVTEPFSPLMIGVGDSPVPERVKITPAHRAAHRGGGSTRRPHIALSFGDVHLHGDADAKRFAKHIGDELEKALANSDSVPEEDLVA